MGIQTPTTEARELQATVSVETTYNDVTTTIAAGDSFNLLGGPGIEFNEERIPRNDANGSRSYVEQIPRRVTSAMGPIASYVLPPGGATPPDIGALIRGALGSETIGGSNVTYAPAAVVPSLALGIVSQNISGQHMYGSVVDQMTLAFPSDDEPTFSFNLQGATDVVTLSGTCSGAVDGSSTAVSSVTLTGDNAARAVEVGSRVKFVNAAGTVESTGHRVTAVNNSTQAVTITPSITVNLGTAPTLEPDSPYSQGSIATASPVSLTAAQVNWAGGGGSTENDICIQSGEIQFSNNPQRINCWGSRNTHDMSLNRRMVSGNFTFWARRSDMLRAHLGRANDSVTVRRANVTLIFGDNSVTGTPIMTVNLPRAELEIPTYDFPDEGPASVQVSFLATASSSLNDEISIVFASAT